MYLPRAFAGTDLADLDALLAAHPFITLVTLRDGLPVADHVPVLYRRVGARVELRGHVARANPLARGPGGPALAIAHGPHAYVSPAWYPDKEAAARVPTWNYVVAHLAGALSLFEEEAALAAVVDELSRVHEARLGSDWRYGHDREEHRRQLRGITGFRLVAERVELKCKLSQNHPDANRASVAAALAAQDDAGARAVGALMAQSLQAKEHA
ncbi:MAG TPA: FMN-binding negative transcriptional regulator [Xanthomonadaceae bacterium]|nr:FMN-binding negative transcriptional regulator [Xanthomonadaceae bacterium]